MEHSESTLAAVGKQLLAEKHEPIAIVGVGLRLSKGIIDLDGLHQLLLDGQDNIVPIPKSRWDHQLYFKAPHDPENLICTNEGGYLDDIDKFDPAFFSISPKEARYMDPQQRVMLELCWHALENAGLSPAELRGGDGSVFVGTSSLDYAREITALAESQLVSQLGTGTANSAISGRISYFLGWRGPCLTVDTACSSSLVAIHLAATALRNRETSVALAAGINIVHHPRSHIIFTRANMLSPDGRCKTFAEGADGYGRSEGAAVLVLRRLSDALADRNRILAVVRGTAVRQDGESGGLTVPNGRAQEAVMREALERSLLTPADVSYVEAHGTGTPLGDPIEIHSIDSLFSERSNLEEAVYVASSKTNLAHMEAAAGVGGVLKCLAQLDHGLIYPHAHFDKPSSKIDWNSLSVTVPPAARAWDRPVRRALVNSFGFAGTIASVVLEQAPATPGSEASRSAPSDEPRIVTLSGKSPEALVRNLQARLASLEAAPALDLDRYVWTSSVGRQHHEYRWAASVGTSDELVPVLRQALADVERVVADAEQNQAFADARVAFLLTGQGAQFAGMGAKLYRKNRVFREALDEVSAAFDAVLSFSIRDLMFAEGPEAQAQLRQTRNTQPALFAFNYAVARMWFSYGIEPSVMLGHSVGEIVAACLAGLFSLEDAVRMTARRAELMQAVTANGAMLAVKAPRDSLAAHVQAFDDVGFGGFNGPAQTVLSGGKESLEIIAQRLAAEQVAHRWLDVSHAFHSVHMQGAAEAFREFMQGVTFLPLQHEFVSNVSGAVAEQDLVATPEYWARHICEPVDFSGGMASIAERGGHIFLETGPSPHLTAMGRGCVTASEHRWLTTFQGASEDEGVEKALIGLYCAGQELRWRAVHAAAASEPCDLPAYAFDREAYWLPAALGSARSHGAGHRLLGQLASHDDQQWTYTAQIAPGSPGYLADHVVMGRTILAGTSYVEIVLALQDAVFGHTGMALVDLQIHEPLLLADEGTTELSTYLQRRTDGSYGVEVRSLLQGQSRVHFTCRIEEDSEPPRAGRLAVAPSTDFDKAGLYSRLASFGLKYGPQFQRVESLHKEGPGRVVGTLSTADVEPWEILNPGLFDGVLHTLEPLLGEDRTLIPVGWSRVRLWRKPRGVVVCSAELHADCDLTADEVRADLAIYSDGQVILQADGLRLREVKSRERSGGALFHRLNWQAAEPSLGELTPRPAIVIDCPDDLRPHLPPEITPVAGPQQALEALRKRKPTSSPAQVVWFWNAPALAPKADAPTVLAACQSFYEPLLKLVQELERNADQQVQLCLVTRGAQATGFGSDEPTALVTLDCQLQTTLSGFCSVLNSEFSRIRAKVVDLPSGGYQQQLMTDLVHELSLADARTETQVAYRAGKRLVRRLAVAQVGETQGNFQLAASEDGLLSGLRLQSVERALPADDQIEVRVEAAGLNFKDVINALGLLKQHAQEQGLAYQPLALGFECAGVVTAAGERSGFGVGDAVMVSQLGCMQRYVTVSGRAAVRIPAGLSMAQAASIPTAFITSYYSLYTLARVSSADRVLIHAAAGGVGQAALQLCRRVGAKVFATASKRKWELLRQQGVEHVLDSRTTDFADEVLRLTDGQGVSVVLNSLNKDFIPAGLRATAQGGRFVEIGKLGVWSKAQVAEKRPDVAYSQFDLSEVPQDELLNLNKAILEDIAGFLAAGEIAPAPIKCFPVNQASEAFGILARGENVGKIVLTFDEASDPDLSLAREVRPEGTYLVTGGYGALGQRAAEWLARAGARHVALLGRRVPEGDALEKVRARLVGCESVDLRAGDVADAAVVDAIFAEAAAKGRPVCGVVHLAGVIADAPITDQTWESFRTVFSPKVVGTWNLWQAAAKAGVELFVGYSSVASVIGSISQANYAAGNAFIDGLMNRQLDGKRIGLSINWGPWAGAGMAAELTDQQKKSIARKGIVPIPLQRGIEAFGRLAREAQGQIVVGEVDWGAYKASLPADDALYDAVGEATAADHREAFDREKLMALPTEQRKEAVLDELIRILRRVLQYAEGDRLSRRASFSDLGLDSLVAVELRNSVEKSFGLALTSSLVFDYPTLTALSAHLLDRLVPNAVVAEVA